MGFAWMPDNSAGEFSDLYQDNERVSRRRYRKAGGRAGVLSPAGRHALSHSQRRLLASFGVASLVPLGTSRGTPRGAHAARLPDVQRRSSGWSGPERWRRWA